MRITPLIAVGLGLAGVAVTACSDEPSRPAAGQPSLAVAAGAPRCDPKIEKCEAIGRMTGGGGQIIIGDVRVTRGFTIHCDIVLSNNLEINWSGNRWHLDKPLTSAQCVDDPAVSPEPPPAPFDTFIGEGDGRLNGQDGSRVEFIFVDEGEPGGKNDRAQIQIFDSNGALVLNVPMSFLDHGNLQAHYDQPHGSNVNR